MATKVQQSSRQASSRQTPKTSSLRQPSELRTAGKSTVLILVGGSHQAQRLLREPKPGVLADVGGRPFLSFLLEQVEAAGYRKVVLCTGYRSADVLREYGDSFGSLSLRYSEEELPQGTGGALRWAAQFAESERVLAMKGDSFCDVDLRAFESWAEAQGSDAALVAFGMDKAKNQAVLDLADDRVVGVRASGSSPGFSWVNAGIYSLRCEFLRSLPLCGPFSLEHDIFERQLLGRVAAYRHCGRFLDLGKQDSLASIERFLEQEF